MIAKSPSRVQLYFQLETSHSVDSSARVKSPRRQSSQLDLSSIQYSLYCIAGFLLGKFARQQICNISYYGRYPQLRHNWKNDGASVGSMKTLAGSVERKCILQRFKHGTTR